LAGARWLSESYYGIYLVFDVDVGAVVDEKTHDVHVVVDKSVEDSQM